MTTLAVQVVTEEIVKVTSENGICETHSAKTTTEALVALSSENIEASLTKQYSSSDSGISMCESKNNLSDCASKENENEEETTCSQRNGEKLMEKSSTTESEDQLSQEQHKLSMESNCSQESRISSNSTKSSFSSVSKKSESATSKFMDENSNSSSNSTLKGSQNVNDEDENSCSSISSSTSTIKTSQPAIDRSDNESNSRSSFKSSSRRSLPEKESGNENTFKRSQSVNTDLTEDNNSRSSDINSHSRSTTQNSQPANEKMDDESNSRSSFKSSSKKSSPEKESESGSIFKRSQSLNTDPVEDNDSRSSVISSNSRSTTKNSQPINDKSDDESNSTFSFKSSSKKSSPEKESKSGNTSKKSQSLNTDLTEDNDSCSSAVSSNSRPTKITQPRNDKSDDESNSRSSFKSSSKSSTPGKENKKSQPKKYFNIIDSDSEDEIILSHRFKSNQKESDSETTIPENTQSSKSTKKLKIKNQRKLIDSDSDEESIKIDKASNEKQFNNKKSGSDSEKEDTKAANKSKKISNIVDSDSDVSDHQSEPRGNASSGEENLTGKPKKGKKKSEKKRVGSARASKDIAMQQIHSETQRLIRESNISLPYHRPKQRTLQEFLNRKKVVTEIPKNLTCAEKVKMFPEMISKVVQEKEKEAEIFYKSSDSEEENEPMEVGEVDTETKNKNESQNINENIISDVINISDTQKLTQDDIQESHNKRAILQQRFSDFGVPRKLFLEDANDMEETENVQVSQPCPNEDENLDPDNVAAVKRKHKEVKTGLRESSIPRKLFSDGTEDIDMDVDTNENDASISEDKIDGNTKLHEHSVKSTESTVNKTDLENSTEDIVLNLSETEHDKSEDKILTESNKISDLEVQNTDQESIRISETPFISNKEHLKLNRHSIVPPDNQNITENGSTSTEKVEESEDLILKLAKETNEDDAEIVDYNALQGDFGLPIDFDEPVKKPSVKEKVLAQALKLHPTIKASPGSVIDLTSSGQMKEGVTRLLDRFVRHSKVHKPTVDEISEVKIIRTEGTGDDIQIIEEVLPFRKAIIEDDGKKEKKPGEKLKILRENLKRQIANVRNKEWKQKEEDEKEDEEEELKCKGDDFYEGLPDEEELLEDEESGESEPEEDDMPIVESRRPRCEFADEEAEESEDENAEDIGDNENDNEEQEVDEEEENEEDEENDDEEEESEKEEEESYKPKKRKRIIKPFDEDSNQSDSSLDNDTSTIPAFNRSKADDDMFATQTNNGYAMDDADAIPLFQPRDRCGSDSRSQTCKTPLPKSNNILSMISPVAQLTALNTSLDSAKKSASKTTNLNLGHIDDSISAENTPKENSNRPQNNCNLVKMMGLQKKLFEDPPDTVNDDELLQICSGKFSETQNSQQTSGNDRNEVTDSQLMELCSGAFVTQPIDLKKLESTDSTLQLGDESSQDIKLTLDDEESRSSLTKTSPSVKRSDESMFSNDSKSPVKLPTFGKGTVKNSMEAWLKKANPKTPLTQKRNEVTDTQLMDICSGTFTSQSVDMKELEKNKMSGRSEDSQMQQRGNEVTDTQLMDLCSGTFTSQPVDMKELEKSQMPGKSAANEMQKRHGEVTDTQLLDLCSGVFPTQLMSMKELENNETSQTQSTTLLDLGLTLDNSKSPLKVLNSESYVSQKKSGTSLKQTVPEKEEESKTPWTAFTIVSSSDDDDVENKVKKVRPKKKILKKKKVQKLKLSDDEDDNPNEFSEGEESEIEEEDDERYVDYDSEENEVVVVPKKDIKKVAANFLENEAELSESDWDSADEDEQDLDKLEFEEADAEDIDENKMKDQLDKIHMKQVMDDDQREVRLLQELLFDDGDLHTDGAGRERRFKWKNIDSLGNDELGPRTDDNIDMVDDEVDTTVEFQMRKMRYEQQKFLEEKEKNIDKVIEDDFSESQLFNVGLKVVSVRSTSKSSVVEQKITKANSSSNQNMTLSKKTFTSTKSLSFSNMRGSFLARGDETLVRIAQNLTETSNKPIKPGRKGKFVFAHLSPSVSNAQKEDSEQENDNTPAKEKDNKTRKRKMFSSQSQTPRSTKKIKVDERTAGKKLF